MARSRYRIRIPHYPHFLTCTIVNWITLFNDPEIVRIIFDSWRFLQEQDRLRLYGYVILENHLHFIAESADLAREVANFKSFTASKILGLLQNNGRKYLLNQLHLGKQPHKQDRTYQVWQEGSHPEMIISDEMLNQKLEYMHFNQVRRGYVNEPAHWRYSSAANYAGMPGLMSLKAIGK